MSDSYEPVLHIELETHCEHCSQILKQMMLVKQKKKKNVVQFLNK